MLKLALKVLAFAVSIVDKALELLHSLVHALKEKLDEAAKDADSK